MFPNNNMVFTTKYEKHAHTKLQKWTYMLESNAYKIIQWPIAQQYIQDITTIPDEPPNNPTVAIRLARKD